MPWIYRILHNPERGSFYELLDVPPGADPLTAINPVAQYPEGAHDAVVMNVAYAGQFLRDRLAEIAVFAPEASIAMTRERLLQLVLTLSVDAFQIGAETERAAQQEKLRPSDS